MKLLVEISDNKSSFGIQVLQSLDFVESIESQDLNYNLEFEKKWNDPSNLTIEEARISTKSKIKSFWKK